MTKSSSEIGNLGEAHFATKCLYHESNEHGGVAAPIHLSTTFKQKAPGVPVGDFEYARSGNPTRQNLENMVAHLDNGKFGVCVSSGSAALVLVMHLLSPGDHLILGEDCYGGTFRYVDTLLKVKNGVEVSFVDTQQVSEIEKHIQANTKLIWIETPSNPNLRLTDIKATADLVKRANKARGIDPLVLSEQTALKDTDLPLLFVVDNTFLSPCFQRPLDLGADLVVYSMTKYLCGHSDVVMGTCITKHEALAKRLYYLQNAMGMTPSPMDCYLAIRGLKTLNLRMHAHEQNALVIAAFLDKHARVERVNYPGLPGFSQHALAKDQMLGFGGIISFQLAGEDANTVRFVSSLRLITLAESLGAVESLIELPGIMTHASMGAELRSRLGITNRLVRLSVGIEQVDDLLDDIKQALDAAYKD